MIITTTAKKVQTDSLPGGGTLVKMFDPDVAEILEQIGEETCREYFDKEAVAAENREAAKAKDFPLLYDKILKK